MDIERRAAGKTWEGPALSKVLVSIVGSATILGSLVVAGVALSRKAAPGGPGVTDLSMVESELSALRDGMEGIKEELRALRQLQESASGIRVPIADEADAEDAAAGATLPDYVAAVLAEERKLQEAERERQREERRVRMEERRKELEAMREGPYDRYNVKVNSLGKVLALTDAQKQSYHQLVAAYNGKLEETLKQMREAREAERTARAAAGEQGQSQEGERGPGRGRRGDATGREQFRELLDGLQKGFAADVASLLSPEQAQTYGELSRSAQGFQSTDMVAAPGEGGEGGRFAGFGSGGRGGGGPGGGGGRRGR
jgi:hypothetical protein